MAPLHPQGTGNYFFFHAIRVVNYVSFVSFVLLRFFSSLLICCFVLHDAVAGMIMADITPLLLLLLFLNQQQLVHSTNISHYMSVLCSLPHYATDNWSINIHWLFNFSLPDAYSISPQGRCKYAASLILHTLEVLNKVRRPDVNTTNAPTEMDIDKDENSQLDSEERAILKEERAIEHEVENEIDSDELVSTREFLCMLLLSGQAAVIKHLFDALYLSDNSDTKKLVLDILFELEKAIHAGRLDSALAAYAENLWTFWTDKENVDMLLDLAQDRFPYVYVKAEEYILSLLAKAGQDVLMESGVESKSRHFVTILLDNIWQRMVANNDLDSGGCRKQLNSLLEHIYMLYSDQVPYIISKIDELLFVKPAPVDRSSHSAAGVSTPTEFAPNRALLVLLNDLNSYLLSKPHFVTKASSDSTNSQQCSVVLLDSSSSGTSEGQKRVVVDIGVIKRAMSDVLLNSEDVQKLQFQLLSGCLMNCSQIIIVTRDLDSAHTAQMREYARECFWFVMSYLPLIVEVFFCVV